MRIEGTRIFADGMFTNQNKGIGQNQNNILNYFNGGSQEQDKVLQKHKEAREKAMKLVKDVFEAEKSIDDDLSQRAGRVDEAQQKIVEANKEIRAIDEQKEELKTAYGITEDSQEQKDLELLEKRRDSMKPDSDIVLTEEERERLAEIDKEGMTDYQRQSLELDALKAPYNTEVKEAKKLILEENAMIKGITQERLKSNPMTGAVKQAEEIMEAASKEIISMITDEAKENIDASMEETKEEADKAKEEQEELEEHIEEIQQKNAEMEAQIQEHREDKKADGIAIAIPMDRLLELDAIKTEVNQEVEHIMHEMKMLKEDIKGSVVDTDV